MNFWWESKKRLWGKKTKVGFLGKLKSLVGRWRGAIGNEMLTNYERGLKSFFGME